MYKEGQVITSYYDREERERYELSSEEQYKLSKNQAKFVNDAMDEGYPVDFCYSGRGMYGKYCPAVRIGRDDEPFRTKANYREDSMGLGYVMYAQY